MNNEPTLENLLAIRDSEPVAAETAAIVEGDPVAQRRLAHLRQLKDALKRLPNDRMPRAELWEETLPPLAKKPEIRRQSRALSWPAALVATTLIVAATLLIHPLTQDDGVELSRTNLAALQDRSRVLEGELMNSSRYSGTASEQALLFRLADVDTQLSDVNQNDSISSMHQRELLWQRRGELMEALKVVQRSTGRDQ